MTTITASCPLCGEVKLTHSDVTLRVCTNRPALSCYSFECPGCHDVVRRDADSHAVSLLRDCGVCAEVWEVPGEALEVHDGPPLTYDDLLDFALGLGGVDLLASLLASGRRS